MRARDLWIPVLLAVATAAVYAQVRTHEFVNFDDYVYVVDNPNFQGGLTVANVVRLFTTPYAAYWIPLTWTSLLIDHQLHGTHAGGYLLTNLALHILDTLLLYWFFARATGAVWRSAFVAAVFALHPLHVESVAWVTERKDVLSVFFGLLTLHAYHYWCRRRAWVGYAGVVAAFALALLSKPSLVTLPVVLLLLDFWPLARLGSRLRAAIVEKIPLLAMSVVVGSVAIFTQASMGGMQLGGRISTLTKWLNGFQSLLLYLVDSLWPTGLAVVYPMPLEAPAPWLSILGAIVLAAACWGVWNQGRSRPYLVTGWMWFLVTIAPASGFLYVGVQGRADRFMYVPLIGLAILAAWGLGELAKTTMQRRALVVAAWAAVLALGACSYRQVSYWKDTVTLFERAIAVTRDNYVAHNRLAEQYKSQLRMSEAEAHYAEAMRIDPAWITPQLQFANLCEALGDQRVAAIFRESAARVQAKPDFAPGFVGIAWMQAGRFRLARPNLERAVSEHPEFIGIQNALATVLAGLGEPAKALDHLSRSMRLEPDHPATATNRAWLLATAPDDAVRSPEEAARVAEAGLQTVERLEYLLLDSLGAAYAGEGRFADAVEVSQRAAAMASERGDSARAAEIQKRIDLYRAGRPYLEAHAILLDFQDGGK